MTTNLLQLTDAVTKDTDDTLLEEAIREHLDEIRKSLQEGRDYILETPRGQIIIRAKQAEQSAKSA